MTFRQALLNARGHIVFLLGLIAAFALVFTLERWEPTTGAAAIPEAEDLPAPPPLQTLDPAGRAAAEAAWGYFEANIRPETGLVDTVAGFPATTIWDTGSFLLGAVAAERLGVLPSDRFDAIVDKALGSLAALPLYDGLLPNKSYDTTTLAITDYANRPVEEGIGWSALDLGRALVALHAVMRHYPEHAPAVQAVLDAWDVGAAVQDGVMMGAAPDEGGGYALVQEGRVGYEQYAAKGFALLGYDVHEALRVETFLDWADVYDVEVPTDSRDPETFGGHAHTLSEPYVLDGLEFGWDVRTRELAWRVYQAQVARFEETGLLTAVTEDHLDRHPRFVYSTVYAGEPWAVLTDVGEDASGFRTLSTKAAIGWHALYRTPYTERLYAEVRDLSTPEGWFAGRYEELDEPNAVLAANTNAVILEALHYWAFGPLLHPRRPDEGTEAAAN